MKIGILSYWDSQHNYGQLLQCFAMQRFLRGMGHEPYHVRYMQQPATAFQKIKKLVRAVFTGNVREVLEQRRSGRNPAYLALQIRQQEECRKYPRSFDKFRREYINMTDVAYTYGDLRSNPPEADCYVVGSDQVWGSADRGYLLDFGNAGVKRIAYAPSMGGVRMSKNVMSGDFKRLLRKFDVVTVREEDGAQECRNMGRDDVSVVPDPVLLLTAGQYREISVMSEASKRPYVFVYLLGNTIDVPVEEIFLWCSRHGFDVKYVTAQNRFDDFPKLYPNIDEWIGLLDGAEYVFTNSFHGMVMSIVLNKPFLVFPLCGAFLRMNSRIDSTLNAFGLQDRRFDKSLDEILVPVDFEAANGIMSRQRDVITEKFRLWLQ